MLYALLLKVRYIRNEIREKSSSAPNFFFEYTPCLDLNLNIGFSNTTQVSKSVGKWILICIFVWIRRHKMDHDVKWERGVILIGRREREFDYKSTFLHYVTTFLS